ncbi:MAG: hypothetical protein DMG55_04680 [Acidobacteria bacterium]|nr:MAG: hypothetical protein DMG55_04680 [Acidobacteriota bacterium]
MAVLPSALGGMSDQARELAAGWQESAMEAKAHRPTWKTLLAFAIVYFVWGSTFLAIRVGTSEVL